MVRLWERAIRRADIPVVYSEGFNPRQKLSFGPPLSLGIASDCELLDIYLETWIGPALIKEELEITLPEGIKIVEVSNVFSGMASLSSSIKTAVYEIKTKEDLSVKTKEILSLKEILTDRKDKKVNIRPMIKEIVQTDKTIQISVQCDNFGSIKAQEIIGLFPGSTAKDLRRVALI
jgi:radical SAM-linked protein